MQCNQQHLSSVSITCRVSIWGKASRGFQKQPSLGGVAQERQLLNRHYCPWPSHRPLHCLHAPCTCMGTTTVACRVSSNTQWCKQHGRHGSTPAPSALQCGDSCSSGKCSTEANHCFLAGHLLFHSERQLHPTHYTVVVDVHISTLLPVRQLSHHPGHAAAHTGVHPSNKHISTDLLAIYFCGVTKLRRGWIPMTYGKQLESLWISAVPGYITVTRITPFQ